MKKNIDGYDLQSFYNQKVKPYVDRKVDQYTPANVVFVDCWNSYQLADKKVIWYGGSLYYCHKERVREGGFVIEQWEQDPIPLNTGCIYVDKEHDALYRWDGSDMVPMASGGGGGITVVETDLQTYEGMASHDASTLYVITSLTPAT